jgi:hypothetical protein
MSSRVRTHNNVYYIKQLKFGHATVEWTLTLGDNTRIEEVWIWEKRDDRVSRVSSKPRPLN